MNEFTQMLKLHRRQLSRQQLLTLKGQAKAGDVDGALKGLNKIIARKVS